MEMTRKVGTLHAHKLPDGKEAKQYDVFRCVCNKEFYMDLAPGKGGVVENKWFSIQESPHLVEYAEEEVDAPRIGRWKPSDKTEAKPEEEEVEQEPTEGETTAEPAGETDVPSGDTTVETSEA